MTDSITVTGIVGTDPTQKVIGDGVVVTSFRLASNRRYFDKAKGSWESTETNWFTVSAFRQLGQNAGFSVRKGQHVIVQGRLKVRAWETGTKSGTSVDIEADAIGHDLAWCISSYARTPSEPRADDAEGRSDASGAQGGAGSAADAIGSGTDWSGLSLSTGELIEPAGGDFEPADRGDGIGADDEFEGLPADDAFEQVAYADAVSD